MFLRLYYLETKFMEEWPNKVSSDPPNKEAMVEWPATKGKGLEERALDRAWSDKVSSGK